GRPICHASSGAISLRMASIASTALERILPRSGTGTRRHSACAMRAAFTAASISASDALARRTTSRLSTGEMQTMSGMWLFLRHPRQLRTMIGVAGKGRIERQLLFDSLQPRGDQRRKGEIWIEVRAADAALDADRLAPLPAQPEARGAIVAAPHGLGRREGAD